MKSKILKHENLEPLLEASACEAFSLVIGVICGSIVQIKPLLNDINNLRKLTFLKGIEVVIVANGETYSDVFNLLSEIFLSPDQVIFTVIGGEQKEIILPIGQARTKLQKFVGLRMEKTSSYSWILDDDMRIPLEAATYLTWLPAFKSEGVDVLIGSFDGASPNPPAHGIRVQVNDLVHNLNWLNGLSDCDVLPNRSHENKEFRSRYSDYYYDLSRKHKKHLDEPYWITPEHDRETVWDARQRMIENIDKILTGEPFLRPLMTSIPIDPLSASQPSCNRGGNTFILTSKALTLTPNAILLSDGEENRRSDMIWAIINRYYHNLKIHAVSFSVYHHRYVNVNKNFNFHKTISEIRGAALYAAILSFFKEQPDPKWKLLQLNIKKITDLYYQYIERRLSIYKENFLVINNLLDTLEVEFKEVINVKKTCLDSIREWVSQDNLQKISTVSTEKIDVEDFILSVNGQINSF